MKKLALIAICLSFVFVANTQAAAKAKPTAEELAKYDTNKDGKLDKTERAAMDADKKKAKEAPATPAK